MKGEIIFTVEERAAITQQAAKEPKYQNPYGIPLHFMVGEHPTDIKGISMKHHLILTLGNQYTGLTHIIKRHAFFSGTRDWQDGKLTNPNRFSRNALGGWEYIQIADSIFNPTVKQTSPMHLEKESYEGKYTDSQGIELTYRLILYENTKIIHTLFPLKSPHNVAMPNDFPFTRGRPYTRAPLTTNTIELIVPYEREDNTIAYSISLVQDPDKLTEEFRIICHDNTGVATGFVPIHTFTFSSSFHDEKNWRGLEFSDELLPLEKDVRSLHKQLTKNK